MSKEDQKKHIIIKLSVLAANILIPMLAGLFLYLDNSHYYSTGTQAPNYAWTYVYLTVTNVVL